MIRRPSLALQLRSADGAAERRSQRLASAPSSCVVNDGACLGCWIGLPPAALCGPRSADRRRATHFLDRADLVPAMMVAYFAPILILAQRPLPAGHRRYARAVADEDDGRLEPAPARAAGADDVPLARGRVHRPRHLVLLLRRHRPELDPLISTRTSPGRASGSRRSPAARPSRSGSSRPSSQSMSSSSGGGIAGRDREPLERVAGRRAHRSRSPGSTRPRRSARRISTLSAETSHARGRRPRTSRAGRRSSRTAAPSSPAGRRRPRTPRADRGGHPDRRAVRRTRASSAAASPAYVALDPASRARATAPRAAPDRRRSPRRSRTAPRPLRRRRQRGAPRSAGRARAAAARQRHRSTSARCPRTVPRRRRRGRARSRCWWSTAHR